MTTRRRWLFRTGWSVIGLALLLLLLAQTALWGGTGNVVDLLRGQFPERIQLPKASIWHRQGSTSRPAVVEVDLNVRRPIHRVTPRYLSFAIDTAQIVGGKWWDPAADRRELSGGTVPAELVNLDDAQLDRLTEALAPAYLRIGGSEADRVFYDLTNGTDGQADPPAGYDSTLTRKRWNAVCAFARRNGLEIVFTLNAGPSSRDPRGHWRSDNASTLIRYSREQGCPVAVWELGNELNAYWFLFGRRGRVSAADYDRDLRRARALVQRLYPDAKTAGQGAAFWPLVGEPLSLIFGFTPKYLRRSGGTTDIVSWHYYPPTVTPWPGRLSTGPSGPTAEPGQP
jgi:heparanase 1